MQTVARLLQTEIRKFQEYRNTGISLFHRFKDLLKGWGERVQMANVFPKTLPSLKSLPYSTSSDFGYTFTIFDFSLYGIRYLMLAFCSNLVARRGRLVSLVGVRQCSTAYWHF